MELYSIQASRFTLDLLRTDPAAYGRKYVVLFNGGHRTQKGSCFNIFNECRISTPTDILYTLRVCTIETSFCFLHGHFNRYALVNFHMTLMRKAASSSVILTRSMNVRSLAGILSSVPCAIPHHANPDGCFHAVRPYYPLLSFPICSL